MSLERNDLHRHSPFQNDGERRSQTKCTIASACYPTRRGEYVIGASGNRVLSKATVYAKCRRTVLLRHIGCRKHGVIGSADSWSVTTDFRIVPIDWPDIDTTINLFG